MLGRVWHLETFVGEPVKLSLQRELHSPSPRSALEELEMERLIDALIYSLDEPRRRALESIYRELTGAQVPFVYSPFELSGDRWCQEVRRTFEQAAQSGHLHVEVMQRPRVAVRQEAPKPHPTMALRPQEPPPEPSWFEVRLVDEVGEPLDGVELSFSSGSTKNTLTTNGDGVARFMALDASFGSVHVVSTSALREKLQERWSKPRQGVLADEPLLQRLLFSPDLPSVRLESETRQTVSIQPRIEQARLLGGYFDTNKTFLLPSGIRDVQGVKRLHQRNTHTELLIVGHTDTSGDPAVNDPLSFQRAESLKEYLQGNAAAWFERYGTRFPPAQRWGATEDSLMIRALQTQGPSFPEGDDLDRGNATKWYQEWHNRLPPSERAPQWEQLAEDGIIGPKTRGQLVADYMLLSGPPLPEDVAITTRGAGENFPLDETGEQLDTKPADGQRDATDRRVDVFFFDKDFGIQPPAPPGTQLEKGSVEYPEWWHRAHPKHNFGLDTFTLKLYLHDEHQMLMPNERYELTIANETRQGTTDDTGLLLESDLPKSETCVLRWKEKHPFYPPRPGESIDVFLHASTTPTFLFRRVLTLVPPSSAPLAVASTRLDNLGYTDDDFSKNWAQFQLDYDLAEEGGVKPFFDQRVFDHLAAVHGEGLEPQLDPRLADGPEPEPEEFEDDARYASAIELDLVDPSGAAVPSEEFELRSPDGTVVTRGNLDGNGRAIVFDLPQEEYLVSFPRLHQNSWSAVKA